MAKVNSYTIKQKTKYNFDLTQTKDMIIHEI